LLLLALAQPPDISAPFDCDPLTTGLHYPQFLTPRSALDVRTFRFVGQLDRREVIKWTSFDSPASPTDYN